MMQTGQHHYHSYPEYNQFDRQILRSQTQFPQSLYTNKPADSVFISDPRTAHAITSPLAPRYVVSFGDRIDVDPNEARTW